jgi:hypothetical protein
MLPPLAAFSTSKGSQVTQYLKLRKKGFEKKVITFRESTGVNIIPNNEAKVKNYGLPAENFCTIREIEFLC